jgi:hypothetical protein
LPQSATALTGVTITLVLVGVALVLDLGSVLGGLVIVIASLASLALAAWAGERLAAPLSLLARQA